VQNLFLTAVTVADDMISISSLSLSISWGAIHCSIQYTGRYIHNSGPIKYSSF